jgi:hypothetical protein
MRNKKNWFRPELIVLARSKPEEAVLTHCKRIAPSSGGPSDAQTGCDNGVITNCGNCQSRAGS